MKNRLMMLTLLSLLISCIISCDKKASPNEDTGQHMLKSVKSLTASPGYYRIALSFVVDAEYMEYCLVTWGNPSQYRKIPVSEAINDTIHTIIDGLSEGDHSFQVATYDASGTVSDISVRVEGSAYGDKYIASLVNRSIVEQFFIQDSIPRIYWSASATRELAVNVRYEKRGGGWRTLTVKRDESSTELIDYKPGTVIEYRTAYLPEPMGIDTFYAETALLPAPSYYSSITNKRIIEKSGLVNELVSQTSMRLHNDVEYSNLQFRNRQNSPLNVSVVKADLSRGNVAVSALLPNNGTTFGLQTVKEMAAHRDEAGDKVLAAVNADFFTWTPVAGTPWGPVVSQGRIIKSNTSQSGTTYFGVTSEGAPQIGYFSPGLQLGDFRELVGGGHHWLVVDGSNGSWGGDTREPRTSVGYTDDSVVYLLVVDGRSPGFSVGVELTDLALIMKSLGVHQAINLDGGGSSTMVLNQHGIFEVVNRYSDELPRAVANALAITLK